METLLELLARIAELSADERDELQAQLVALRAEDDTTLAELSDEDLAAFEAACMNAFDAARQASIPDVELLGEVTETVTAVRAVDVERQTQAEAEAERIAEMERTLRPEASDEDGTDDSDDGDDGDGDAADGGDEEAETPETAEERETVTAAGRPSANRVPLSALAARRPARNAPADTPAVPRQVITASVSMPMIPAGSELADLTAAASLLVDRVASVEASLLTPGEKQYVARVRTEHPAADERRLLRDASAEENTRRIEAVVASARAGARTRPDGVGVNGPSAEALVAAGGLCAPLEVRYEQNVLGSDYRPVRDALVNFPADRGGVRYIPDPVLSDITTAGAGGAVGIWSMTNDSDAVNDAGVRKPIQRIVCADEVTVLTYAVTKRLLVGNVLGTTYPERVRAMIELVNTSHARLAENQLLKRLKALATKSLEEPQVLGSVRDFLHQLDKTVWNMRNRHRIPEDVALRCIAPDVLVPHIRSDLAWEMPGATAERLAVTLEEIRSFTDARNVNITFTPDMDGHMASAQAANGQLRDLASPVEWVIFTEGSLGFLDSGMFDLGFSAGTPIRDTTRNAANDYELFGETFENVAKFGGEVLWNRSLLAPTGEVSGTVDTNADLAS